MNRKIISLLYIMLAAIVYGQAQQKTLSNGSRSKLNVNKLLENSARTELIGCEMWNHMAVQWNKGDYEKPDSRTPEYGISQIANSFWAKPQMGMIGDWAYGVETTLSDVVKVKITSTKQGQVIIQKFVPTRNEWTPALISTYYRALPDTLKGSYPYAGDLNVKERKCITKDNVLVLEYSLTHDNRTNGEYDIALILPKFKKLESSARYSFSTNSRPRSLRQVLPIEGFVAVENSEKTGEKFHLSLKPFETKTIRFTVAFESNSMESAIKNAQSACKNSNVFADNINDFNKWFDDNVPQLTIDNYDMLRLYYYRWFVLYRNYHNPGKYINKHPFPCPVFYESPFGGWYGSTVGLSIPVHNQEAKWAKTPEMAQNNILNWAKNRKMFRDYIQYTPKTIWDLYLHYPDKVFLDSVYKSTSSYSKEVIDDKDKTRLPTQTGSWDTGAEYQPSFYEFTKDNKWDWQQDSEGKPFNKTRTTIIRLDKVVFAIANSFASSNIAKVLGNKTDESYFNESASLMLQTVKEKHWDAKTGMFYSANPVDYALAKESPCYDSFMPFMWQLVKEKSYQKSFDKFFDPAWFWSDYPISTVSKTCPMYWSGNCIAGPAFSSVEKPHDYDCSWNGPTWFFSNGLMCEALGSVALNSSKNDMKEKWMDFFNRWSDMHYAYGDKTVPCATEHNRPTDGARFSRRFDYFHSSWIDPFMRYYLGIQIDDNGNFNFNPFTKEEFEVNDISIMGKKYSFSQQIEGNSLVQKVFDANKKLKSKKAVKL